MYESWNGGCHLQQPCSEKYTKKWTSQILRRNSTMDGWDIHAVIISQEYGVVMCAYVYIYNIHLLVASTDDCWGHTSLSSCNFVPKQKRFLKGHSSINQLQPFPFSSELRQRCKKPRTPKREKLGKPSTQVHTFKGRGYVMRCHMLVSSPLRGISLNFGGEPRIFMSKTPRWSMFRVFFLGNIPHLETTTCYVQRASVRRNPLLNGYHNQRTYPTNGISEQIISQGFSDF